MRKRILYIFLLLISTQANAQRQMENLDRGVVAVRNAEGKVFVSWRLLSTDPDDIAFDVWRANGDGKDIDKAIKINRTPVTKTTNILDETADTYKTPMFKSHN